MQSSCRVVKILSAAMAFLLSVILFCCGCADASGEREVSVTIVDSVFYTARNPSARVKCGGNFSTEVTVRAGYELTGCDYGEYRISDDKSSITLLNVTRPSRVVLTCTKNGELSSDFTLHCTVKYDLNGGAFNGKTDVVEENVTTHHLRPNTWNGIGLERKGYTLCGWNTAPDASGEHIGLGSRVTVLYGETCTLYAEWLKQLDESLFLYKKISEKDCSVTGYRGVGDSEPFVIPDTLGGMKVVAVSSSFTKNMPCKQLTAETLVLPNTVKKVSKSAFANSSFKTLYFWDNIEEIDKRSFFGNIKTYRINAYRQPCFQDKNNSTLFADNFDRLIMHADRRKLILFSGCSFAYGADCNYLSKTFGNRYTVFNMGMNGDINGAFQMEIILNFIGEGDVLVHAPEQMSPAQLMYSFYTNNTMFIMCEGNYDLLSLADFSENDAFFGAFSDYIELKDETEVCSYAECRYTDFNIYGDYTEPRPYDEQTEAERDVTYSDDNYCYAPELLTEAGIVKLAGYYDAVAQRGGRTLVSYAPVNISARGGREIAEKGLAFAEKFESMLSVHGYEVISCVEDYMFRGRYFFDSDYHLNDLGAALRTERLIKDLKEAGV